MLSLSTTSISCVMSRFLFVELLVESGERDHGLLLESNSFLCSLSISSVSSLSAKVFYDYLILPRSLRQVW